jgi:hypothetical protein
VYEEGDTVLWNQTVHPHREVTANRTDIIIKNTIEKTCTLIDVATLADRNVVRKEAEKKLKYKRLSLEIHRMWNLKSTIIPLIVGATGIVTKSLRKNLKAITGKHWIDSLQKTAILGTSHKIRKILQCETGSLSGRGHRWFKRNTRKKRSVTRDNNYSYYYYYVMLGTLYPYKRFDLSQSKNCLYVLHTKSFPFSGPDCRVTRTKLHPQSPGG